MTDQERTSPSGTPEASPLITIGLRMSVSIDSLYYHGWLDRLSALTDYTQKCDGHFALDFDDAGLDALVDGVADRLERLEAQQAAGEINIPNLPDLRERVWRMRQRHGLLTALRPTGTR